MSIFEGKKIKIKTYGESHSEFIGASVSGVGKIKIDYDKLTAFLERRKPYKEFCGTERTESDIPVFSGVEDGVINGDFSFKIANTDVKKSDYDELYAKPRPSHADVAAYLKDGTLDFTGGGRFSGRLTAVLCVIGGIFKEELEKRGVKIAAYISSVGGVNGTTYKTGVPEYKTVIEKRQGFPSLSAKKEMLEKINDIKLAGDSVGGRAECIVYGLKPGVGNDMFEGLEGKISSLVYAIPAVKGVEFGLGFDFADSYGTEVNDEMRFNGDKIEFLSNSAGGIYGGISVGLPITFGVAIKPTPSIKKPQRTVDLVKKQNVTIEITGRHDACIAVRAIPCIEAAAAIAIYDELL